MRPLKEIAKEISKEWPTIGRGALPYLNAMYSVNTVNDAYGADDGRMIVLYFLSNATGWRGEAARRIKAELKFQLDNPAGRVEK